MIEGSGSGAGSGSGTIALTSGSGSGRPKNMWIFWIRIRIRNTALVTSSYDSFDLYNFEKQETMFYVVVNFGQIYMLLDPDPQR
jgi:hypothetical protein